MAAEPVEVDEEEGQVDSAVGAGASPDADDENDVVADDDDDDDGDEPPPPPPPPMPSPSTDKPSDSSGPRKRKVAIGVAVGVAACAAIGLGLGFGLRSSKNDANDGSNASSASSGGNVGAGEEEAATTTTTEATTTASSTVEAAAAAAATTTSAAEVMEMITTTTEATTTAAATTAAATTAAATTVPAVEVEDATTEAAPVPAPAPVETYDTVIIGAGWSGIRAVETLIDEGIDSVLVLEANGYVGGRAKSVNSDGTVNNPDRDASVLPYDVGCEWLYAQGDRMTEVLEEGGYVDPVLDNDRYSGISLNGQFYQQKKGEDTAEPIDRDEWFSEMWWGGFLVYRENRFDELEGLSYAEAIDKYIDRWGWTDDGALQFFNLVEDTIETEYTADSSQMSVTDIEHWPEGYSFKTHWMGVPGMGYGNVAAEYAERFESKIRLNSKVVEVNSEGWDQSATLVKYVDENGATQSVKAKTVLVTVSLGVLKAGTIKFVPSLPENKQESIDNMGFGLANKVKMSWNDQAAMVWPDDKYWFLLITPEDETSGKWTQFFNPTSLKGVPALTAWIGGAEAVEAEKQTDDEILADVMKNLRVMFPDITEPDNVIFSRWGQEENVRGTHSYPIAGRDHDADSDILAERFGNIWFSGEATRGGGWGTTMGAWNTGEDEAKDIADWLLG